MPYPARQTRRTFLVSATLGGLSLARLGTEHLAAARATAGAMRRYEYVFPDGELEVYDHDRAFAFVKRVALPTQAGVRGVCASARTASLYISYGGDGGSAGNGALLKYDLIEDRVVWTRDYAFGIDSMSITPDGRKIFMPSGELSAGGTWYVLSARDGGVIGAIDGPRGPHNTIISRDGGRVYLGGRAHDELFVADTSSYKVIKRIGPFKDTVRPFTIDRGERFAYTAVTGFLGFQVASIRSGKTLYTVGFKGFTWNPDTFEPSCPSHGVSLSPSGRALYVMDAPNSHVHVFDVTRVPALVPRMVTSIPITSMAAAEFGCAYDCARDGWLSHSHDGRFVFVGDAGDVIRTSTRQVVNHLPSLANTRKYIEIDFDALGRVVWAANSRSSIGDWPAR
jgi:hypothetical protein